jgi:hypothetical protein
MPSKPTVSLDGKTLKDFPEILARWHSKKNGNQKPHDISTGSKKKYWWKCPVARDHVFRAEVYSYTYLACSGHQLSSTNRLDKCAPHLAKEWHFEKNSVTPDQVVISSGRNYWWRCPKGSDHEWQARIKHRLHVSDRCPFCSNHRLSVTNRLDMVAPFLLPEWDHERNHPLLPSEVTYCSQRKVWWRCAKGPDHLWQANIRNRVGGSGCPFCSHLYFSITHSLAISRPDLAEQWHPTKNGMLKPTEVSINAGQAYWWQCPKDQSHEWRMRLSSRYRGAGCPICRKSAKPPKPVRILKSLAECAPYLIPEWHPSKNEGLGPQDVAQHSRSRVWWKCPNGPDHEWQAYVHSRTGKKKPGCPYCAGQKRSITNSLATVNPQIAAQWHPTKNGDLRPEKVGAKSQQKVHWRCEAGHEWVTSVYNRTQRNRKCEVCEPPEPIVIYFLAKKPFASRW